MLKSLKSLPDYGLLPQNFIERRDKLIPGGFTLERFKNHSRQLTAEILATARAR